MEKNIVKRKKIGTSLSHRNGNYRVEYFKVDKYSNIGSVEVGCYIDASYFTTIGNALRHFNRNWYLSTVGFDMDNTMKLIWVPSLNESIIKKDSFCNFTVQFKLDGLSIYLDEVIYEVIEDFIINTIELSNVIVSNK